MLKLQTRPFDICRISKLLVKYEIKASISNQVITLDGEISDELLDELCDVITICKIQNFDGKVTPPIQEKSNYPESHGIVSTSTEAGDVAVKTYSGVVLAPKVIEQYDLRYPTVKRGEVYLCDFGEPYGSEQGNKRHAIVVQNNDGNFYSPTTIVLPCTTQRKKRYPVHYHFVFSNENMLDYDANLIGTKPNIAMAEQIRTVDKTRLRKFLGTMTPEFMNKLQDIIDVSLDLRRQGRVITKKKNEYVDKPVEVSVGTSAPKEGRNLKQMQPLPLEKKEYVDKPVEVLADTNTPKAPEECKDLKQMQLLSLVDINELFRIVQARDSNRIRVQKILELFGFDMQKNGVQYLFQAILISTQKAYFNLETLCDSVAKSEPKIEKDEVKRLIVARIKEQFKLRKSPAIDFIRLVNRFLIKKGG